MTPLVFLEDAANQRSGVHPSEQMERKSFKEWQAEREPAEPTEFTEEQLAFRKAKAEAEVKPVSDDFPQDDVPEV